MAFEFINTALNERRQAQLFRQRVVIDSNHQAIIEVGEQHYISFSSNDYLGLSQHQDVLQSYAEGLSLYGASGSASSVITGYSKEHRALEADICEHTNKQSALLFSSGFAANQAICAALFSEHSGSDVALIADKFMHASFLESAINAKATNKSLNFSRYKHNDMTHLTTFLKQNVNANTLVATEGVFSMDGDQANISAICSLLATTPNQLKPWLYVDDAHALGVIGKEGMGSCALPCQMNEKAIDVLMGTFGKAIGTQGAFIAGSSNLIDYLVNYSKHFVYSTAIPAAQARATLTSLRIMRLGKERALLQENIQLFKRLSLESGLPLLDVDGPIQPLILGCPDLALRVSSALKELGIWVNAIRYPTVPKHSDRLRITLSALHQERDIVALVDALSLCLEQEKTS